MTQNENLLTNFYSAFQHKNFLRMQECYADDAVFTDEVFINLSAGEVRAMWEMLIKKGKDLVLEFKNIQANDTKGSAEWIATYTFSKTKRKIINSVKAEFVFKNGKIVEHTDKFDFYKWSRQALGTSGMILGWTNYLKKKVQLSAQNQLKEFMKHS